MSNSVNTDPDILGGTPVFRNTRVPVKTLFDYLKDGDNINLFLEHFPSVDESDVKEVLEMVPESLSQEMN